MSTQPSLLDPSGSDLPGPIFEPRPGWGGKLAAWFRDNFYIFLFRGIIAFLVAFTVAVIFRSWQLSHPAPAASPTPGADTTDSYTVTVRRGEGLSYAAAQALAKYLVRNPDRLDAVQHLWAVDRIWHSVLDTAPGLAVVHPDQQITVPETVIEYALAEARNLSPAQRRNLQTYLK